jgi:ubiquitin-protein ligase
MSVFTPADLFSYTDDVPPNPVSASMLSVVATRRIKADLAKLQEHCEREQNVFVRAYTQDLRQLDVLMVGAKDTPYEDGLYGFTFLIPNDYPFYPPNVQFTTTHRGKYRLNPNLYSNGYVCLSLLNTWNDPRGSPWQPVNTLVSVIISIQAMILNDDPWMNEPNRERVGPVQAAAARKAHLDALRPMIRQAAITDHVLQPHPLFASVINKHFTSRYENVERLHPGTLTGFPEFRSMLGVL